MAAILPPDLDLSAANDPGYDAAPAINQALQSVVDGVRGVRLPPGVWYIGSPIDILPATRLEGQTTTLRALSGFPTGQAMLRTVAIWTYGVRLANLTLDANGFAAHGLSATQFVHETSKIEGLAVLRATSHGFRLRVCTNLSLVHCRSEQNAGSGFRLEGCNHGLLESCISRRNDLHGYDVEGHADPPQSGRSVYDGCVSERNGGHGFRLGHVANPSSDGQPKERSNRIRSSWISGNGGDGIHINHPNAVLVAVEIHPGGSPESVAIRLAFENNPTIGPANAGLRVLATTAHGPPAFARIVTSGIPPVQPDANGLYTTPIHVRGSYRAPDHPLPVES